MVRLNRIYTKTGDGGETGLGDGSRVAKHALRVEVYGTVDELLSVLGLAILELGPGDAPAAARLQRIQNELFDVGADLANPRSAGEESGTRLRIEDAYVERLEAWIDEANEHLEPLRSFVLPGGTRLAGWLHLARTVCRRAERLASALLAEEPEATGAVCLRYLNRLSDLLFVLARRANDDGRADVLWVPGGDRSDG